MNPLWLRRERALRRMVADGMKNEEIAERWGIRPGTVANMKYVLGVKNSEPAVPTPLPRPITTYVEDGRIITRYPSGLAEGAGINFYTAKPRGQR